MNTPNTHLSVLVVLLGWSRHKVAGKWDDTEMQLSIDKGIDLERDNVTQMKTWIGKLGESLDGIQVYTSKFFLLYHYANPKKHKAFWSLIFFWHLINSAYSEGVLCDFSFPLSEVAYSSCLGWFMGVMASLIFWVSDTLWIYIIILCVRDE